MYLALFMCCLLSGCGSSRNFLDISVVKLNAYADKGPIKTVTSSHYSIIGKASFDREIESAVSSVELGQGLLLHANYKVGNKSRTSGSDFRLLHIGMTKSGNTIIILDKDGNNIGSAPSIEEARKLLASTAIKAAKTWLEGVALEKSSNPNYDWMN